MRCLQFKADKRQVSVLFAGATLSQPIVDVGTIQNESTRPMTRYFGVLRDLLSISGATWDTPSQSRCENAIVFVQQAYMLDRRKLVCGYISTSYTRFNPWSTDKKEVLDRALQLNQHLYCVLAERKYKIKLIHLG